MNLDHSPTLPACISPTTALCRQGRHLVFLPAAAFALLLVGCGPAHIYATLYYPAPTMDESEMDLRIVHGARKMGIQARRSELGGLELGQVGPRVTYLGPYNCRPPYEHPIFFFNCDAEQGTIVEVIDGRPLVFRDAAALGDYCAEHSERFLAAAGFASYARMRCKDSSECIRAPRSNVFVAAADIQQAAGSDYLAVAEPDGTIWVVPTSKIEKIADGAVTVASGTLVALGKPEVTQARSTPHESVFLGQLVAQLAGAHGESFSIMQNRDGTLLGTATTQVVQSSRVIAVARVIFQDAPSPRR